MTTQPNTVRDVSTNWLELSYRAARVLNENGIVTLGQLATEEVYLARPGSTQRELRLAGAGKKVAAEYEKELRAFDLDLGMSPDDPRLESSPLKMQQLMAS